MKKIQKETLYVNGEIHSAHGTIEYKNNSFKEYYVGVEMVIENSGKYSHRRMLKRVKEGVNKVELYIKHPYEKKYLAFVYDNSPEKNIMSPWHVFRH